jgi:hypothetical protein
VEAARATAHIRPLGIGEILDLAIKIYMRHAPTFFRVVLVVVVPIQLVSSLVELSATSETDEFATTDEVEEDFWIFLTALIVATILTGVAGTLATAACFRGVAQAYLGEQPDWRGTIGFAVRRLHSVVWVTFLYYLVIGLGFLLCVVPGIWAGVAFAAAVPVLLTEGIKGRRALGRSRRLVKGRWWPTFAVVLIGYILTAIVGGVIGFVLGLATLGDPDSDLVAFLASAGSGILASVLTTPFTAAFITVLYFDLRVRKEGFDLQVLAERIGRASGIAIAPLAEPEPDAEPGDEPPFWPPPPGWRPRDRDRGEDG